MNALDRTTITIERDGVVLGRTTLSGLLSASWHASSVMRGAVAGMKEAGEQIEKVLDEVYNPKAPLDERNKSVMMGFLWFLALSSMQPPSMQPQREQETIEATPPE